MSNIFVRQGDVITAQLLNELANQRAARGVRCSGGVNCRENPDGSLQIWGNQDENLPFLAVTSTAITANVVVTTGTKWTQGGGSVFAVNVNGSNLEADTSTEFDVINWSTTTGGIPINTLVWVTTDGSMKSDGTPNWFATAVDCGN
jgi:hypothetical protein